MTINILSTTDVHGYLDKGLGQLALLSQDQQVDLLLDNGDFLVGSAFATYGRLQHAVSPVVYIANEIGYQVMVPGNHDLDYGLPWLQKQVEHLKADYVCANLVNEEMQPIFKPYSVLECQGKKIAVIGLMTYALSRLMPEAYFNQVQVLSPFEALKNNLVDIEADFIVLAYHGGLTHDPVSGKVWHYASLEDQAYQLMEEFPQIDALICGHQHFVNAGINEGTGTALIQPGAFGQYAGYQQFNEGNITENQIIELKSQLYSTKWDKDFQTWLSQSVDIKSVKNYIQNPFPHADFYLLDYQAETIGELVEELSDPFPLGDYLVSGREVLKLGFDISKSLQADKLYKVVASPQILPASRLRKAYLMNLFDQYMINGFEKV